jgi:glycosyltransferase involved in cell wall biosynthesis
MRQQNNPSSTFGGPEGPTAPPHAPGCSLTYSLADQNFTQTKSLGIFKLSLGLAQHVPLRPEVKRFTVLANSSLAGHLRLAGPASVLTHDQPLAGRIRRMLWDQWGVYQAAVRAGNPWLCLPKGFASTLRKCPVKLATYVHDTVHEFYRRRYPGHISPLESFYFRRSLRASIRHSTVIFTNSEFTRSEILRLARELGLNAPEVIAIGIGFSRPATRPPEKEDRLLVLTTRWPHKRADLAVDYLARWHQASGYAGTIEWLGSLPENLALPGRPGWVWHRRVPEEEYDRLLSRARALIYFTEYEGFGMPPVEAVMAGACPVYSEIPATREVMQGLGCPFENSAFESFRTALDRALAASADGIRAWAGELAGRHRWESVAERFVTGLLRADATNRHR